MGEYVYKVTAKKKTLSDGTIANVAVYAYKLGWDESMNRKAAAKSGCRNADRFAASGSKNWTGLAVIGETGEVAVPVRFGTFTDSWFDREVSKMREKAL